MNSLNDLFKQYYGSELEYLFTIPFPIVKFCRNNADLELLEYLHHKGIY